MTNRRWLLNWQAAAICALILIELVVIASGSREKSSADYGYEWVFRGQTQQCGLAAASWDRYGLFRFASQQTLAEASDSFSLEDFIVSGPDTQLRKEGVSNAITEFQCVIKITPEEDGAWSNLAWLYAMSGDTPKAIASEQKAISLYRFDYTYYVLLGGFLERSGRIDEAQTAYGNSLTLFPRLVNSEFWHALQLRRSAIADAALHSALITLDQSQLIVDEVARDEVRARLLAANGFEDDANDIVSIINARLPNLSGMWELQGELNERKGRKIDAILDYRRAIFLAPLDPVPHEHLAGLELDSFDANTAKVDALLAWRLAQHPWSPGMVQRTVQYQRNDRSLIDEFPITLLGETQPSFGFKSAFNRLSRFFAFRGEEAQHREMEHMVDQSTRSVLNRDSGADK